MRERRFNSLLTAVLLAVIVLLCLRQPGHVAPEHAQPQQTDEERTEEIRVMTLSGTTGFGMAKLMDDAGRGKASLRYAFTVESDAADITAALINGSCDIAALPTNAAAALYQKSGGAVQCLALTTRGVLYLLTAGGEQVDSLASLEGRTVYAPAQNPTFIFSALCDAAGVHVTVDNSYAQPADLRTGLTAGLVSLAVLPEPMVSIACSADSTLSAALDLTREWDKVFPAGSLVQSCAVIRKDFAAAHPEVPELFLTDYAASVAFLTESPDAAAELVEAAGLLSSAAAAKAAIPNCNFCFLTGSEMCSAMDEYLEIMLSAVPASVGGALPDSDFYCVLPMEAANESGR